MKFTFRKFTLPCRVRPIYVEARELTHMAYFLLVGIEGHGLYATAALIMLAFEVTRLLLKEV